MSRKLILLVDDDRDTLEAYAVLFQALGHATAGASDGPAALAAARHLRPDLILLDIGLPTTSGLEVLRQLRADATGAKIPVIVLTGRAVPSELAEARQHGCHVVFTKPCEPVTLCHAVEATLHSPLPFAPQSDAVREPAHGIRRPAERALYPYGCPFS